MEIIASIIQIIPNLCTQISHQTEYVRHLKNNVDALLVEAGNLKALCKDTESAGREASREKNMLTYRAQAWLDQARPILDEIEIIKLQFDQRRAFCNGCFPDLCSDYTLGKRAFKKLERVRRLVDERNGIKLVAGSSPPRVIKMDVPTIGQSSAQRTMEKIWKLLFDEHTSVIYVYGMGGIGKTTLMKAINNKLQATREFEVVIWVTVSKELDLQWVQKEIMGRLHLKFAENDSYHSRSTQLRQYLTDKRYMLILDDLWDCIDLYTVGIPPNKENRARTVITTRNATMSAVQVFSDMKAEKIGVETLTEEEAWDLFAAKVGKKVLSQPRIKRVAKDVAKKCGGLPLAIVVVAKAMEEKSTEEQWQYTLRALGASAPKIEGMEPEVFIPLKLSYDDLKDEEVYIYGGDNYSPGVKVMVTHTGGLGLKYADVKDVSQFTKVLQTARDCLISKGVRKWNAFWIGAMLEKMHYKILRNYISDSYQSYRSFLKEKLFKIKNNSNDCNGRVTQSFFFCVM